MAQVVWTTGAVDDLEAIMDYIAEDAPDAARDLAERVVRAVERVGEFPGSGRMTPEMGRPEYRETLVGPYRILYRVFPDAIRINAIVHGARQQPNF